MKISTKFYLSLAAGIALGLGVSFAIPVLAHSSPPEAYVKMSVKVFDHTYVTILEDRERNRVCYIKLNYQGDAIDCDILDRNNPR